MHTAVLALGMLLILSELGAIGFMMVNTVNQALNPKKAVSLIREEPEKKDVKVVIIEDKKVHTTMIADPAAKKPTKKLPVGSFSLVP